MSASAPAHAANRQSSNTSPSTERRLRGGTLLVGAVLIVALIETGALARYWFPVLTGATYLAAAAVSRSRGTLWAPGLIITTVGLAAALWLRDGRSGNSFELLALAVMGLGLGGVIAALLGQTLGWSISAMSVSLSVLLFGVFALLEEQGVEPVAGSTWVYAGLLAAWGLYELRPGRPTSSS